MGLGSIKKTPAALRPPGSMLLNEGVGLPFYSNSTVAGGLPVQS